VSQTTPFYQFDPNLGNPRDRYIRADEAHPEARQPEIPGTFIATVEGETMISTMHGRQAVAWRAEPGTPCIILGYWADGTVHLKWAAIGGTYRIDGRFPGWVAAPDPTAVMAGGGRILRANNPITIPRALPAPFAVAVLVALAIVVLVLLLLYIR
jgi:hypothetical protein